MNADNIQTQDTVNIHDIDWWQMHWPGNIDKQVMLVQ